MGRESIVRNSFVPIAENLHCLFRKYVPTLVKIEIAVQSFVYCKNYDILYIFVITVSGQCSEG